MVIFTFFVFGRKYPVWDNLVQKINIVSLRWNLIPRIIWICWIQWCCSLFSFLTGNTLLGQIWSKLSIFTAFMFPIRNALFWVNLVQKIKIISLSWNLVPILIRICRVQWWCWLFLVLIDNILFGQIWSNKSNYQFKLKFGT